MYSSIPTIPTNSYYSPTNAVATPAPKTVDAMRSDIGERFAGMVWIKKNETSELGDYFVEYDHWEEYCENKSYTSDKYHAAYKGTMKEYQNYLCLLTGGGDDDKYYVAAKRIPGELETLEKYCPCFTCSSNVLNPLKYVWCPHCTGCIKAGVGCAKKEYIIQAHERKQLKLATKFKPNKYMAYIPNLQWYKCVEVAALLVIVIGVYIML